MYDERISKKKFVNFNQRDINLCYSESYKTYNENRLSIIISLLEKLSFPVHLVGDTIKRFRAHMGDQHCFEHYSPQFRMGPTIKIAKHMLNKARGFTMPGVDLLFQINTKSPIFFSRHANEPSKLNISKGIVSGIDRNLGEKNTRYYAHRTYSRWTLEHYR